MTVLPTASTVVDARDASQRQEAARNAYLASLQAGTPLTGADLGRQFGRTDRWGRMQIRKFRDELESGSPTGNGQHRHGTSGRRNGTGAQAEPAHRDGAAPWSGRSDAGRHAAAAKHGGLVPLVGASAVDAGRKSDGSGDGIGTEPPATDQPESAGSAGKPEPPADKRTGPEHGSAEVPRKWLDSLVTLAVALVCAAASFGHMYHVALLAGEPVWIARAWPVTVDGLVLAALRRGHEGRWWLALGITVSMAANVLAQVPELAESAGPLVSAWPPVALYGTHRLLHGARRRPADGSPSAG